MHFYSPRPFAHFWSALFLYLSYSLHSPLLARASGDDTVIHEDHNHHRLLNLLDQHDTFASAVVGANNYEPDFAGFDRSILGRAPEAATTLDNNVPEPTDIDQGDIQYWIFPRATLQGPYGQLGPQFPLNFTATNASRLETDLIQLAQTQNARGGSRTVWLTISTCDQPTSTATGDAVAPSQLEIYVSLSRDNQRPDNGRRDHVIAVEGGYGSIELANVSDDIYIGVRAPESNGFRGVYNYELAASIDLPYATFFNGTADPWNTSTTALDTDANSSLLGTGNITNAFPRSQNFTEWMAMNPPFSVYVHSRNDPSILGLQRSICGLRNHAQIKDGDIEDGDKIMVKTGGQPKQLFYIKNLNRSSSYHAIMTLERSKSGTIGGGGAVWSMTNFTTKSDTNCQIIHSLPFCTNIAYAVPSNPNPPTNMTALALIYDTYANDTYQNFDKSLQQIPCDTTPSAQYSLARNCDDCADAYKTWLCAVTIPRCADFSSPSNLTHLQPRNIAQNFPNGTAVPDEPKGSLFSRENKTTNHYGMSRNRWIDDSIKPGPYKEVLPCKDLCYHLMQNCPAALKFACPTEKRGLNYSYGHYTVGDAEWMCNWPGGNLVSGVGRTGVEWGSMAFVLAVAVFLL
ncbi:MAG: hypothetical protein Q9216_002210 [Gyalolechia sp. 2 TL-2023]